VRWLEPGTWHLTLLFLDRVTVEHVPELISLVERVAGQCPPFAISVSGGGGRVRGSDGVAWLQVHDGASRVAAAAELLAARYPPLATAAAPPKRTPAAHLTVARKVDRATLDALAGQWHGPLAASLSIDAMALLRSHLGSGGARYETLHEATLYPRRQ
jgi:RNA 2',3'-cyclic 3'-phosphodiesterase